MKVIQLYFGSSTKYQFWIDMKENKIGDEGAKAIAEALILNKSLIELSMNI